VSIQAELHPGLIRTANFGGSIGRGFTPHQLATGNLGAVDPRVVASRHFEVIVWLARRASLAVGLRMGRGGRRPLILRLNVAACASATRRCRLLWAKRRGGVS